MEEENVEEKIRQAVLAIRKSRTNPAGRHWLDVADGFLAQALALSSPHPEAREEDIDNLIYDLDHTIPGDSEGGNEFWGRRRGIVRSFLSRLAAPKPEGQKRKPANPKNPCADCKNGIGPRPDAICDECEGDESDLPSMWEPAPAPEPRPAEEPFVSMENPDTHLVEIHVNPNYSEPAPAPSEEAMPEAIAAADMINDAIDRARVSGDGAGLYTRILSIVDEALRSKLARKDEALARIERMTTRGDIKEIARAALREPDGRKGE